MERAAAALENEVSKAGIEPLAISKQGKFLSRFRERTSRNAVIIG